MTNKLIAPSIAPLVRRHAEDAGFYWSQHDSAAGNPHLTLSGLERFSHLLDAHLEGLAVAGDAGWEASFDALARWKKPAEAFVCARIAFGGDKGLQRDALWAQVDARPDLLLRGVVSALASLPSDAREHIRALTAANAPPVRQVAGLRALALLEGDPQAALARPLGAYLGSEDAHVRAAAWRLGAVLPASDDLGRYAAPASEDDALAVRAEAAIACGRNRACRDDSGAAPLHWQALLVQCVHRQAGLVAASSGANRALAMRRLARWVGWLAVLLDLGSAAIPTLLQELPPSLALAFAGSHGDPAWLPYVVERMAEDATCRYAGWVWQTVTGVDLVVAGLSLPEPDREALPMAVKASQADQDHGLPRLDPAAVRAYPLPGLSPGERYLLGRSMTAAHALSVFDTGSQAQRALALRYLDAWYPQLRLSIRAAAENQRQAGLRLRASLEQRRTE